MALGRTAVPTRNVNLTDELDRFVLDRVKSGRYENSSEVVRAALRTLEREEQQYQAKLAALRQAIDEGDASGVAGGQPVRPCPEDPETAHQAATAVVADVHAGTRRPNVA
jgi:antitoxin ParD1/3/4